MKMIIDAQLPFQLTYLLRQQGCEVIHTDDLPNKERTSDDEIRNRARQEGRIVVSKDLDFLNSYYLKNDPERLLIITTGNIKNKILFKLILDNLKRIAFCRT